MYNLYLSIESALMMSNDTDHNKTNFIKKYNINNFHHTELASKFQDKKLSLSAVLSEQFNFKNIFITHEILSPGRQDSVPHFHSKKEELLFILEGNPTLHVGDQIFELVAGDFIGLQPCAELHYVENMTENIVKFLKICSNPQDDVVTYVALET